MNPENIMISERSHSQKATHCVTALLSTVQNREIRRYRNWISGWLRPGKTGALGSNEEWLLRNMRFLLDEEAVPKLNVVMVVQLRIY